MANKVTIDVEARFIDNVTDEAKAAAGSFDKLEKAAEGAQKDLTALGKTKAKPKVDADTSKAMKKLNDMDKKLSKLDKINDIAVRIKDHAALKSLNQMSSGLKSLTSKAWNVAVKVKDTFTAPITKLKNMLFNVKNLVAGIAAAWATQKLVLSPISVADAYSSAKISFSTLLGATAGQKMMDDLDQFAKATPFNTTNVIGNAQKMLAMGWDAESIIEDMETIGNAAASTGKLDQGLESIVRALSQIKTKGKLSTEELNQLAEAGIAAKAMLAENLGYGTGDSGIAAMTEDLEKGAIASDVAIQALLAGMKKYDGMMDSMANETVEGLWSQMQDAFNINVVRRWGQGLQDGSKRGFGTIIQLLDKSESALAEFGDMMYEIGKTASNWFADKLQGALDKVLAITDTFEFKNADLKGKVSMLWNGLIADPLKEWWEGGGRDKTIETAGNIGSWMGKTLTKGLLAIFGATDVLNDSAGTDVGSSIAGSFVQGFLDNFDGQAITDAFVDAIGNVWGALPWWAKVLIGGYGVGKVAGGISNLAGGAASLIGGAKNAIGSFSIASSAFPILTSSGTGIAGLLGKAGVGLGASTAGSAMLMGGAGIAGGLAGGAALIKGGVDLYRGYTTDDEVEAKASKTSGWTTLGGVGAGAAIGTLIAPGIGTLIGAGIGGIAGWIGGDAWADNIRETDDAINDVSAATGALEGAQEKLEMRAKMIWQNMRDHFGNIKLSLSEIQAIANQIVWGAEMAIYEQFTSAAQTAEASLNSLKSTAETTNKWLWKAGLGVKFSADEKESIAGSFEEYINSAINYAENKHYEFTAAVSLLVDAESGAGKSILKSGNVFYEGIQNQLNKLGSKLAGKVEIALQDGVITLDEHDEIVNLQQQIAEITQKLSDAETQAELELIKVKFGAGNLDADSFSSFMEQMQTVLNERMAANEEAFTVAVSGLALQLDEGAITQEEYDQQLQSIIDGYAAKAEDVKARIMNVELEFIAEAYDIDTGTLQTALERSIAVGLDPINWTVDQTRDILGIDSLSESSAGAISTMLSEVTAQLDLIDVPMTLNPEETVNKLDLTANDFGIKDSYSFTTTIDVIAKTGTITSPLDKANGIRSIFDRAVSGAIGGAGYRGGIFGGDAFSRGGIVGGSTRFIRVNEESPEMVIPLSSQRRGRALKLWAQAGNIMGVPGFARGGIVGGNNTDEGIRFRTYGNEETTGGRTVQVNMGGIKLEINVSGSDRESIVEAIKAQAGELADYIAGQIADSLATEFENTPVRGGAA